MPSKNDDTAARQEAGRRLWRHLLASPAGVRLASHDGQHLEWTDPVLTRTPDGGYGMSIDCAFGGRPMRHWLAPGNKIGSTRYIFRDNWFNWGSEGDALAALEAYRAQQSAAD